MEKLGLLVWEAKTLTRRQVISCVYNLNRSRKEHWENFQHKHLTYIVRTE